MSPRPVLAGGRALAAWIREGGRPDRCSRAAVLLYRWRGFWFDQGLGLLGPDGGGGAGIWADGAGLLFLMGFWRSGTTLLHELMAAAPGWGAPRTWQCMDPLRGLRGGGTPSGAALRRPMDGMLVGPDSPQEDEFALLALGIPSLYRGFIDPRRLPALLPLLEQSFWQGPEAGPWDRTLAGFLGICREPGGEGLVVKSPNHVFRYRGLVQRFPKAQFLWILRDPAELWASNLRMWRAMTDRYGLWEPAPGGLEAFLAGALEAFSRLLGELRAQGRLGRDQVLGYDQLLAEPERALAPVAARLGLAGTRAQAWLRTAVGRVQAGSRGPTPLPAACRQPLQALRDLQAAILG